MTISPLIDARYAGHRLGVLQAAEGAAGVYRRVGFSEIGTSTEYQLRAGEG